MKPGVLPLEPPRLYHSRIPCKGIAFNCRDFVGKLGVGETSEENNVDYGATAGPSQEF
jgi:hypothetical protein